MSSSYENNPLPAYSSNVKSYSWCTLPSPGCRPMMDYFPSRPSRRTATVLAERCTREPVRGARSRAAPEKQDVGGGPCGMARLGSLQ